jgi:hypothetical protein
MKKEKQAQLQRCKILGIYITPTAAIIFMAVYWCIGMGNYLKK